METKFRNVIKLINDYLDDKYSIDSFVQKIKILTHSFGWSDFKVENKFMEMIYSLDYFVDEYPNSIFKELETDDRKLVEEFSNELKYIIYERLYPLISVSCEVNCVCIQNQINGDLLYREELMISEKLWNKIEEWAKDYSGKVFRYLGDEDFEKKHKDIIELMDHKGIELCRELLKYVGTYVKITYLSGALVKRSII